MQRLAASLLDEQGKRDVAEEGRQKVEDEVDDLAASLFQQVSSYSVSVSSVFSNLGRCLLSRFLGQLDGCC